MKAHVDQDTCIACGLCESICPAVFRIGKSGKAESIVPEVQQDSEDDAKEAESSCPVDAIKVD